MYESFYKSAADTWDDISRRAYGTTEKAGDIAKLNNNIEEGEVLVLLDDETESKDEKELSDVSLSIEGTIYRDFSEYSLIDGLGAIKGAVFIFNKTETDYNFYNGQFVKVTDKTGTFLKGRIANIITAIDNRANWFQVEVKSHAGILVESVLTYPLTFCNQSIKNILSTVASYYNQKITFSDENELDEVFTNEIGTSFSAEINETAYAFMKRICDSRGLLLTDTGDGLFVGRFKPDTEEKLNLIDGECLGVEEIKGYFITDGLARYYELNSQYPETASATVQIPFPVPIVKRFNSNDYNSSDLSTTAARIACTEIGKHFKVHAVISEHYHIKCGGFAIIKNPKIKIYKETEFVIENVIRKNLGITDITLTLPCAYTFEIPKELPLCS